MKTKNLIIIGVVCLVLWIVYYYYYYSGSLFGGEIVIKPEQVDVVIPPNTGGGNTSGGNTNGGNTPATTQKAYKLITLVPEKRPLSKEAYYLGYNAASLANSVKEGAFKLSYTFQDIAEGLSNLLRKNGIKKGDFIVVSKPENGIVVNLSNLIPANGYKLPKPAEYDKLKLDTQNDMYEFLVNNLLKVQKGTLINIDF